MSEASAHAYSRTTLRLQLYTTESGAATGSELLDLLRSAGRRTAGRTQVRLNNMYMLHVHVVYAITCMRAYAHTECMLPTMYWTAVTVLRCVTDLVGPASSEVRDGFEKLYLTSFEKWNMTVTNHTRLHRTRSTLFHSKACNPDLPSVRSIGAAKSVPVPSFVP